MKISEIIVLLIGFFAVAGFSGWLGQALVQPVKLQIELVEEGSGECAIKAEQIILKHWGLYNGSADGKVGSKTMKAQLDYIRLKIAGQKLKDIPEGSLDREQYDFYRSEAQWLKKLNN